MKTCFQLLAVALVLISFAAETFACACCADKGTYFSSVGPIDEYEMEMLGQLKFSGASALYIDEAAFETIKGLDELLKIYEASETGEELDNISLKALFENGTWSLNFTSGKAMGKLSIPLPERRGYFGADIHDGRMSGGGGPLLYKEIRLEGKTSGGTGIFSAGLGNGADYSLVLQGRGNVCNNVEDFTHWRLNVNGPSAKYTFFGKLDSGDKGYFFDKEGDGTQAAAPPFDDYKVAFWQRKPKAVDLSSHKEARMFRTRLKEANAGGVNFAGHYIFARWGCGSGCIYGAIIDAKTGRVYFPKEMAGMAFAMFGAEIEGEPMEYRKDSKLFVLRGIAADNEEPGTSTYVWEGTRFTRLGFEKAR